MNSTNKLRKILSIFEKKKRSTNFSKIILEEGTDEAGHGCLSVPFNGAAVILTLNYKSTILHDSKKNYKKREKKQNQLLNNKLKI
jgi:ribonuclease HII